MCTWIYFTYIYIHTVHIHTHARAHTHGWCRPLQSHGAINSQIYKINRFSSNRSLLDVEVTHKNKTDSNPDPADRTWAPPAANRDLGAAQGWPQHPTSPCWGVAVTLRDLFFCLWMQELSPKDPEPLATSTWRVPGSGAAGHRGCPSTHCQCQSHRSNPEGRWWRGHQIKAAFSNTGWSTNWGFFYQKGPVSLFFSLPLKLILHFLKANFRTNGESSNKIRWVYANSNLKNANSALIVWSQPRRPALQALSSSKQLTS